MTRSEAASAMLAAIVRGQPYPPPGVADTPASRDLWAQIEADIAAMPPGVVPDLVSA